MNARLIPLGVNGFIPTQGRHTMSYLVLVDDQAILLDTGTGCARLLDEPLASLLQSYSTLSIIYSHYHLDHTVGLSYFTAIWPGKPLYIYAPERPLLHALAEEALSELIRPPYFPLTLQQFPCSVAIVPVRENHLQIGSVPIGLRAQKHAGGSVGIRLGDAIAYTTDTVVDQGTVEFVRGVKLLLHELWLDDAETPAEEATRTGHSYASGVAALATEAGAGKLMIVHHHPRRSLAEIQKTADACQRQTTAMVIVPEEGKIYEV
jgi:ribonuclease BN (tRNA processing enzyme)